MMLYSLLVFLHVLGAVGMFVAWGADGVTLMQLARASSPNEIRHTMAFRRRVMPAAMGAMILALVTGVTMMILRWGYQPWEAGSIAALVTIAVVGLATARRVKPVLQAAMAGPEERAGEQVRRALPTLALSLHVRVALGVAILALMTVKPDEAGTVAILGSVAAVALTIALGALNRPPAGAHG